MKIFLYTENKELLDLIREETKQIFVSARQEASIFSFYQLSSAIRELNTNHSQYHVVIIDIDYIRDLKQIYTDFRVHNLLASIVIFSGSYSRLDSSMLLRPSAYFRKPIPKTKYRKIIQFIINEYRSFDSYFSFKQKQKLERIPFQEIEFFESNQRNVSVHLKGDHVQSFIAKLSELETKVPSANFVRCHQSYLVNMENVRMLDKVNKLFEMESGKKVDISRRSMSAVADKFDYFSSYQRRTNHILQFDNRL